jgi:Xaa-Pro aminopeptidase
MDLFNEHKIERFSEELDRVGHHIGLQTEEKWLSKDLKGSVEKGMVIVIEMFTKTDDGFFIGNEDTFVVKESGSESISTLPREILSI